MTPQAIRDGFEHAAQRQADAAAWPTPRAALRGRLAGRHQRHARDDRVQLARRRLLPDHRRPGADADAVDRGRARGEDPQVRQRATTGKSTRTFRAEAGEYAGKWFDPKWKKNRRRRRAAAPTASGTRRDAQAIADAVRGKPATVTEESKPTHAGRAAAVRPDLAAARGQRPLRLLGQDHAVARAGLYERHKVLTYPRTDSRALPEDYLPVVKQTIEMLANSGMRHLAPFAQQAHRRQLRQAEASASSTTPRSRDHFAIIPTLQAPKRPVGRRAEALRPGGAALPRGVLPAGRIPGHHAHHRSAVGQQLQDRGQGAGQAGLARDLRQGSAGRERRRTAEPGAGQAGRDGARRDRRAQGPEDPAAGALLRSHAARRHGRRRQADRRRRAARGDAGEGPRHAGHARGDHRRPDRREVHATAKAAS